MACSFAACDNGGGPEQGAGGGQVAGAGGAAAGPGTAGAGGQPGAGAGSAGAAGGVTQAGASGGPAADGVPLPMTGGWVSNTDLLLQGAVFAYSDMYSAVGMTSNLTAPVDPTITNACIKGTAAKVDTTSTQCKTMMFTAPAVDCFGEFWGAAIGMNLNQPIDPATGKGVETAMPFDASKLKGFAFEVAGSTVPSGTAFRFKVEADTGEFCTPSTVKLVVGSNTVLFSQLLDKCYKISTTPPNPTAVTVQSKLLKISWQVVTNDKGTVPFDFCISNVRALPN